MEEKAAAEARLEVLERDLAQTLVAESSANDCTPPKSGQPGPGISLAMVEQSSDPEHTDQDQSSGADRKKSLAENDTQNESLMTDLYCDYTACLQQIKMLQTNLEAALNEMFDPASSFPTVNSGLTSHERRFLARTVDKSARETLECLDRRILRQSPNTKVMEQYNPFQPEQPCNNDVFLSPEYHQNWLRSVSQNARIQVEARHSNGDDSIMDTDDWAFIDQLSSPTSQRDHKQSLFTCNICSCRFLHWEHFKRHHDTHYTYSKPSEYVSYEKRFSHTGDLMQHQHTYSDSGIPSNMPQHDLEKRKLLVVLTICMAKQSIASTNYIASAPIPIQVRTRPSVPPFESVDDLLDKWTYSHSRDRSWRR